MLSYSVSIPQLGALQKSFERAPDVTAKAVTIAVNRSLVGYQSTAKDLAPISSGRLRSSILLSPAHRVGNTIEGSVGTNVTYSIFQEEGTGIYGPRHQPIVPKSGKFLRFRSGGKFVYVKSVKGSRPRWYFRGSVDHNQPRTLANFDRALEEIVTALGAS